MGEPIRLWDKYGVAHTFYSPSVVAGLLAQGYTTEAPVAMIDLLAKAAMDMIDTAFPDADDTHHDMPAVPAPKRKAKRERGDGGVL